MHNEYLGWLVTPKNMARDVERLTRRLLMLSWQDTVALWTRGVTVKVAVM